jgi:hypothetical protein
VDESEGINEFQKMQVIIYDAWCRPG